VGFRYFEKLNYTLANEDPSLETQVLPSDQKRIVAVGGSGSRILPLLSKRPREVHIIDISRVQLALCELRIETLREFSHSEFLRFWYPWVVEKDLESIRGWRRGRFSELKLTPKSREILQDRFQQESWDAITLSGKWERTFRFFSRLAKWFLGPVTLQKLFSFETIEDQRRYLEKEFPARKFRLLLRLVGSAKMFNALLYRGDFPKNNSGIPYVRYYEEAFTRLFQQDVARKNFFLQLSLLGQILNPESLPLEADPGIYELSKKHLDEASIFYHHSDLIASLQALKSVDFVSFSNVPAYFSGDLEREFLSRIRPSLSEGGKVVIRHYLHYPEGLDRSGFQNVNHQFLAALKGERIQMYDPEILESSR
jgi:S-adenosylmethionine-diacylglycerol 3-amino-3-carboxypropyl transferase